MVDQFWAGLYVGGMITMFFTLIIAIPASTISRRWEVVSLSAVGATTLATIAGFVGVLLTMNG